MPQSHVREDRLIPGDIHVLIAEIGPVNTQLSGDLGIETRSVEGIRNPRRGVPIKQGFVEPFVLWPDKNRVSGEDRLPYSRSISGSQHVAIKREARLETGDGIRPGKNREVEGFVIHIVDFALDRVFE